MLHLGYTKTCKVHQVNEEFTNSDATLNQKIDFCMGLCNSNLECNFFFVNEKCRLSKTCDEFRDPDTDGLTFAKQIEGTKFKPHKMRI